MFAALKGLILSDATFPLGSDSWPVACGLCAAIHSMSSSARARPNCVRAGIWRNCSSRSGHREVTNRRFTSGLPAPRKADISTLQKPEILTLRRHSHTRSCLSQPTKAYSVARWQGRIAVPEANMKTLLFFLTLFGLALFCASNASAASYARSRMSSAATPSDAGQTSATQQPEKKVTEYTLPPDLYRKAHTLGQIAFWGQLAATLYSWIILWFVLRWKLGPKYRDWAEKAGSVRFLQALVFAPPLMLTIAVLNIPFDIVQEWVLRKFGISIQGWGSWAWDWTKGQIVISHHRNHSHLDSLRRHSQESPALVVLLLARFAADPCPSDFHPAPRHRPAVPQVRAARSKGSRTHCKS